MSCGINALICHFTTRSVTVGKQLLVFACAGSSLAIVSPVLILDGGVWLHTIQHTKKIMASNPKFIPFIAFDPIYHPAIKIAMETGPHL